MVEKIRSSKDFWSGGMQFTATVEISTNGCGDNGYPTNITLCSDCSGNYFDVSAGKDIISCNNAQQYKEPAVKIGIRGEWESEKLGDMFIWIGNEINKIKQELEAE